MFANGLAPTTDTMQLPKLGKDCKSRMTSHWLILRLQCNDFDLNQIARQANIKGAIDSIKAAG